MASIIDEGEALSSDEPDSLEVPSLEINPAGDRDVALPQLEKEVRPFWMNCCK